MKNNKFGFTLIELLIVVSLITLIAVITLIALNPKKQLEKTWDAQRKHDLALLKKVLEDFYNDKNRYPIASEICYSEELEQEGDVCSCNICGKSQTSPDFSPYLTVLPCDPEHPRKKYLYQYDCSVSSPTWHRIYTNLAEIESDQYDNYCVSSENIACSLSPTPGTGEPTNTPVPAGPTPTPASCPSDPTVKYCNKGIICNNCGTFFNCQDDEHCDQPAQLFSDVGCTISCESQAIIPTPTSTPAPTPTPSTGPLPSCPADPVAKYCIKGGCNICGTFANCQSGETCSSSQLYSDNSCSQPCQ